MDNPNACFVCQCKVYRIFGNWDTAIVGVTTWFDKKKQQIRECDSCHPSTYYTTHMKEMFGPDQSRGSLKKKKEG